MEKNKGILYKEISFIIYEKKKENIFSFNSFQAKNLIEQFKNYKAKVLKLIRVNVYSYIKVLLKKEHQYFINSSLRNFI